MQQLQRVVSGLAVVGAGALALVGLVSLVRVFDRHPAESAEITAALLVVAALGALLIGRIAARVRPGTVLELDLVSPPGERPSRNPLGRLTGRRALTLAEAVATLARASHDGRVRGLVLRPRFGPAPQAVVQELRDAVAAFGATGKFTVALSDTFGEGGPSNAAYYLATACGEIVMHPTGLVGFAPLSLERDFYRDVLDRIGIEIEVLARMEYKSALSRLSERGFTPADREQSQRLLDSLWDQQVTAVAKARSLPADEVRRLADEAPLRAAEALDAGLVDRLAYSDEATAEAKARAGRKATLLFLAAYRKRAGRAQRRRGTQPVALLRAEGEIRRSSGLPIGLAGSPVLAADVLVRHIRAAAEDKRLKAVVLRIDSPGGSAVASDALWRELVALREHGKPLVVSMGAVAASGGYYLATAADRVVAQPGTITGSIGVLSAHPVAARAKAKLDVHPDEVHVGAEPSMFSLNRRLSDPQRLRVDAQLDDVYSTFSRRVSEGRHLEAEAVAEIARGRVWTGADALAVGLVDELGGLERSLALALELSGAPDGTRPRPVPIPRARAPWRRRQADSSDDLGGVLSRPMRAPRLQGVSSLRVASQGGDRGGIMVHLGCDPRSYWLP